jgi:methylglutaconyl-CoA hydratase
VTAPTTPTSCAIAGGVATVTLDLVAKHNALTPELLDSLGDDLVRAGADDAARVVLLTHAGPTFCAGANLGSAGTTSRFDLAHILRIIADLEKPVVGRIAGGAFGGGVGLAAVCDISLAAVDATFRFSEVRLGVAPAVISVVCLPKMRRADAAELFLGGEPFDGRRAAEVGLVTRAVEPADLDEAVTEVVDRLLLGGPRALAAVKRLLAEVPGMGRDEAFAWTTSLSEALFGSPEAAAGIAAFRERRPAPWVESPGPS